MRVVVNLIQMLWIAKSEKLSGTLNFKEDVKGGVLAGDDGLVWSLIISGYFCLFIFLVFCLFMYNVREREGRGITRGAMWGGIDVL